MPSYKLTYFSGRGRGEIHRLLFAVAGVPYEDKRVEMAQWPEEKPKTPFGQLPILEVDGVVLCQTGACARYLARQFGLAGKSDLEELQGDMFISCMADLVEPTGLFVNEKDETKKAALQKKYTEEDFPKVLDKLQALLVAYNGGDQFFLGNELTVVDLSFLYITDWAIHNSGSVDGHPKLKAILDRVKNQPRVAEWIAKRPVTPW